MITALKQDVEDAEYQAEIAAWDGVAGDGSKGEQIKLFLPAFDLNTSQFLSRSKLLH